MFVDVDHRQFEHVGGGALDRGVHCLPLRVFALHDFWSMDVGEVSAATAESGREAFTLRLSNNALFKVQNRGEALVVESNQLLGFRDAESAAKLLSQTVFADAIQNRVIQHLGQPPLLFAGGLASKPEHLLSSDGVDIDAAVERFDQRGLATQMGKHSKFDL